MGAAADSDNEQDTSELQAKAGPALDMATFEQVLEMDEDGERDFSKSIVFDFFDQARTTFGTMQEKIEDKDLKSLSELGHFLKGSSATLGLTKVRDSCEAIQNYGAGKDAKGDKEIEDKDFLLKAIKSILLQLREDFDHVEELLVEFYREKE